MRRDNCLVKFTLLAAILMTLVCLHQFGGVYHADLLKERYTDRSYSLGGSSQEQARKQDAVMTEIKTSNYRVPESARKHTSTTLGRTTPGTIASHDHQYDHTDNGKPRLPRGTATSVRHCVVYDLDSVDGDDASVTDCVETRTVPSATVCLYPDSQDIFISASIRRRGHWEGHTVQWMLQELSRLSNPVFLDLGANIGMFTNVIAKAGYRVVAVEPNLEHVKRLKMGVIKSNVTTKVTVLHNGLSDARGEVKVKFNRNNQGDTRLTLNNAPCAHCNSSIKTIYLDDMLEVIPPNVKNIIMKMDVQGHEFRAMTHAKVILQTKHVPVIFMEFMEMKPYYRAPRMRLAVDHMIEELLAQGYSVFAHGSNLPLNDYKRVWDTWPPNVVWIKK